MSRIQFDSVWSIVLNDSYGTLIPRGGAFFLSLASDGPVKGVPEHRDYMLTVRQLESLRDQAIAILEKMDS